jgi:hypothetical protein
MLYVVYVHSHWSCNLPWLNCFLFCAYGMVLVLTRWLSEQIRWCISLCTICCHTWGFANSKILPQHLVGRMSTSDVTCGSWRIYRMIKKSLCTWWLQYRKLLGSSDCTAADRQGQGNTTPTLTPSVIPNSNYVIIENNWNCLKYFFVFFYCNYRVHRDFLTTLYFLQFANDFNSHNYPGGPLFPPPPPTFLDIVDFHIWVTCLTSIY